jgi:hypothetical protein
MATWKNIFELNELKDLIPVILILAFGFSYQTCLGLSKSCQLIKTISLGSWFGNFFLVLILVAISVLVHEAAHKIVASKFMAVVKSKLWLSGIIVMLLLMFLSNGWVIFAALWAVLIRPWRLFKPGKPFPHLGPRERALIGLAGPMANLGLALFAKLIGPVGAKLMVINIYLAIFNLLPLLTLLPILALQRGREILRRTPFETPYMEGDYVLFGNRPLWVFVFIFTIVVSVAMFYFGLFASIMTALIAAVAIFIVWHWFLEPETEPFFKTMGPATGGAKGTGITFRNYGKYK